MHYWDVSQNVQPYLPLFYFKELLIFSFPCSRYFSLKGVVYPKMKIILSFTCHSKPVGLAFFCITQKMIFWVCWVTKEGQVDYPLLIFSLPKNTTNNGIFWIIAGIYNGTLWKLWIHTHFELFKMAFCAKHYWFVWCFQDCHSVASKIILNNTKISRGHWNI